MKRKPDPFLRTQPWKVTMVFGPIERILHRLEVDGTVEVAGRQVVFKEDGRGGWYDTVAALRGVIQFHELAASRHNLPVDLAALVRFANKLDAASTIFESDIEAVRACIAACKSQALKLRVCQAIDIVNTVRISMEMDKIKEAA
jgi:hypothetical protein